MYQSLFLLLVIFASSLFCPLQAQIVIVDNSDPGFSQPNGGWFTSANPGYNGSSTLFRATNQSESLAKWTANLPVRGEYEISVTYAASPNRASDAPYRILAPANETVVTVNQTTGGSFTSLGNFIFAAGDATVELSNIASTGEFVSADAVRWVFIRDADPPVPCVENPTDVDSLGGSGNCFGLDLPGGPEPHPDAKWNIHSDLPEVFNSYGVLYTTRDILPADSGNNVPLNLRTQTNNNFTTIDDDFDVFFFHISPGAGLPQNARIVVHVKNNGNRTETIAPSQVIRTQGIIGNIHEFESGLGQRWMDEDYDTGRPSQVNIAAGQSAVIAWSDVFAAPGRNCFGLVRGDVLNPAASTDLEVSVVVIPGVSTAQLLTETENLLDIAATSGDSVPITTPPAAFELRRAVGVFPNFQWRGDLVTIDANRLTSGGESYGMALSEIQAFSCISGRQTVDMALHPGFAHGDTIGNYQVDYRVAFHLVNSSQTEYKAFDLEFGRSGADIGLVYRTAVSSTQLTDQQVDSAQTKTDWAGPNQDALYDSMLDNSITLPPCGEVFVSMRFAVLGNSSLPFQLRVVPAGAVIPEVEANVWTVE